MLCWDGEGRDGMNCYRGGVVGTLRGSIRTLVTGSPRRNQQGWRSQAWFMLHFWRGLAPPVCSTEPRHTACPRPHCLVSPSFSVNSARSHHFPLLPATCQKRDSRHRGGRAPGPASGQEEKGEKEMGGQEKREKRVFSTGVDLPLQSDHCVLQVRNQAQRGCELCKIT